MASWDPEQKQNQNLDLHSDQNQNQDQNADGTASPGGVPVRRTPPGTGGPPPAPSGPALVRVHDLAGRPRGTGFVADHHGTVVT
ncbi:hypothetical protein NGM37_12080, partial [Streptomyces sp. TRM76130]|nr:hypothetical protein [Streptomyces sp. TRM76130]